MYRETKVVNDFLKLASKKEVDEVVNDGMYDAKNFLDIMKKSLDEDSYFVITIPKVPLLMQEDKSLRLTLSDIDDFQRILFPEIEEEE